MKILIQDTETRRYFRDTESWTTSVADALDFGAVPVAYRFCKRNYLSNVRILIKLETGPSEFALRVWDTPNRTERLEVA